MDGLELKKILIGNGYMLKDIAAKLGMTQPNFSQIIKAQDIKTGTLENICDVLGVKMDFFYGETKYAPVTKQESTEDDPMASEDLNQKVQYLQGQLTAMKKPTVSFLTAFQQTARLILCVKQRASKT